MEEIIRLAQQGNQEALSRLLKQYEPLMITFAKKRYVENSYEDTLQESRIAFILALRQYDVHFGVYFGYYVKQRIWQHLSSLKKGQKRYDISFICNDKLEEQGILTDHVDFEFSIWKKELERILSTREQQLFELHWIQGFTISEIANEFQISINTVKTWKKRALKKLRKVLVTQESSS